MRRPERPRRPAALSLVAIAAVGLALGAGLSLLARPAERVVTPTGGGGARPPAERRETPPQGAPARASTLPAARATSGSDGFEPARVEGRAPPARTVLPPPIYHPRPAVEWQGMLVDTSMQAVCAGESSCGLALACIDGRCGPCRSDGDCAREEVCVLDHCVLAPRVACRQARDCREGELCILSGYASDPRGNESMTAECLASHGGADVEEPPPPVDIVPAQPRAVSIDALRDSLSGGEEEAPAEPGEAGARP